MRTNAPTILIVDDERQIRTLLRNTLARAGYGVVEAGSGREAMTSFDIDRPDLVLLDLGLPDRDGLELVAKLVERGRARVIVVSARDEVEQKVAALDLGADDYVTKPFDTDELLARVRACLRQQLASQAESRTVVTGDVKIDLLARSVTRGGDAVRLAPKEWGILAELAKRPGRVLTHAHLLTAVWGPAHQDQTEYLRVAVRALRQKLERVPAEPTLIVNEPAVGYRLRIDA